ncbi:MAG: glycosyltransferase family 2 protein [Desulfovibrio sp.]|jgi:glycosyltransferase involved in cell wall biosynthesis|nr:glycosyltransferase family 2 protein [Desulfovibrio sp.]
MPEGVLPGLTGLVLTGNSRRLLEACLSSLGFCGDLLVVDCFSEDGTLEIAGRHKARMLSRAWTGIGEQFAYAFQHIGSEWIFILDSDEVCSPALAEEIAGLFAGRGPAEETAGYYIPRRSWYFDRFILHGGWQPDRLYRLFRNGRVRMDMSGVHQTFHPIGAAGRLEGEIVHYPYSSFANHLEKINGYAEGGAGDLAAKGRKGGPARGVAHALWRFLRGYVFRLGFLDGRAGFILACHGSFYAFLKYVRVLKASWGAPYDHH